MWHISKITLNDKIEDDATIEGETKPNKEQDKLIEKVKRGKEILVNVDIVDIFDEYETTPLS
jgi:hypothetical protein